MNILRMKEAIVAVFLMSFMLTLLVLDGNTISTMHSRPHSRHLLSTNEASFGWNPIQWNPIHASGPVETTSSLHQLQGSHQIPSESLAQAQVSENEKVIHAEVEAQHVSRPELVGTANAEQPQTSVEATDVVHRTGIVSSHHWAPQAGGETLDGEPISKFEFYETAPEHHVVKRQVAQLVNHGEVHAPGHGHVETHQEPQQPEHQTFMAPTRPEPQLQMQVENHPSQVYTAAAPLDSNVETYREPPASHGETYLAPSYHEPQPQLHFQNPEQALMHQVRAQSNEKTYQTLEVSERERYMAQPQPQAHTNSQPVPRYGLAETLLAPVEAHFEPYRAPPQINIEHYHAPPQVRVENYQAPVHDSYRAPPQPHVDSSHYAHAQTYGGSHQAPQAHMPAAAPAQVPTHEHPNTNELSYQEPPQARVESYGSHEAPVIHRHEDQSRVLQAQEQEHHHSLEEMHALAAMYGVRLPTQPIAAKPREPQADIHRAQFSKPAISGIGTRPTNVIDSRLSSKAEARSETPKFAANRAPRSAGMYGAGGDRAHPAPNGAASFDLRMPHKSVARGESFEDSARAVLAKIASSILSTHEKLQAHENHLSMHNMVSRASNPDRLPKDNIQADPSPQNQQRKVTELPPAAAGFIAIWEIEDGSSVRSQAIKDAKNNNGDGFVCRVAPVAKQGNGRVLLPSWMQKHSEVLAKKCGYNLRNTAFKLQAKLAQDGVKFTVKDENIKVDDVMMYDNGVGETTGVQGQSAGDLIRVEYPREHMPHFATDIQSTLIVADIFSGNNAALMGAGRVLTEKGVFTDAQSIQGAKMVPVRPVLPVNEKVAELPTNSWVHGFLRLIRNALIDKNFLTPTERDLFGHHVNTKAVLFRSGLSYGGNSYNPQLLKPDNIVFARNKLVRQMPSRVNIRSQIADRSAVASASPAGGSGAGSMPCTVKLLILNRAGGERMLIKPDRIVESLRKHLASAYKTAPHVVVEHAKFEGLAFHLQVAVMQEADIVVAPHGAGNTNVVFMRAGATLLEVMPFGYLGAGPFANLAKAYGVEYVPIVAEPDDENFRDCVSPKRAGSLSEDKRKNILKAWDTARSVWKNPKASRGQKDNAINLHDEENDYARFCARHQMLDFEPKWMAASLKPAVDGICGAT